MPTDYNILVIVPDANTHVHTRAQPYERTHTNPFCLRAFEWPKCVAMNSFEWPKYVAMNSLEWPKYVVVNRFEWPKYVINS